MLMNVRRLSILLFLTLVSASCQRAPVFVTEPGIGPDKWGSAWLIRRHIDPSAELVVADPVPRSGGVEFDTDTAELRRTAASTTYEKLLARYAVEDETALAIGRIVRDMEINTWGEKAMPHSSVIESRYRELQTLLGRESVTQACYLQFFDALADELERSRSPAEFGETLSALSCDTPNAPVTSAVVAEIPLDEVLQQLRDKRSVVFIDTREANEFDEYHIPGALRHPLREIDEELAASLRSADLVVPYCVKDFRGYEAARRLQALGIDQVAIMNPYGIKGWRRAGLPVVLPDGPDETRTLEALLDCARQPNRCLSEEASTS